MLNSRMMDAYKCTQVSYLQPTRCNKVHTKIQETLGGKVYTKIKTTLGGEKLIKIQKTLCGKTLIKIKNKEKSSTSWPLLGLWLDLGLPCV